MKKKGGGNPGFRHIILEIGKTMLKLSNISKSYNKGAIKAVDDISLDIRTGEVFGFLGPNGAGKTTTIKMVVGLLKPDSGSIMVGGVNVWKSH